MGDIELHEENRINKFEKIYYKVSKIKKYEIDKCKNIIDESNILDTVWGKNLFAEFRDKNLFLQNIIFPEDKKTIFAFILDSFDNIVDDIKNIYNLDDNYYYKITEIFIEKYEKESVVELSYPGNDIAISILLNESNLIINFPGGASLNIDIGEMIIFSPNSYHMKVNNNNESAFLLVGLLKIYKKENSTT